MKKCNIRWQLAIYDIIIFLVVDFLLLFLYQNSEHISLQGVLVQSALTFLCVFTARFIGRIYQQIWRYGGIQCYIRLLAVDGCAFIANLILEETLPIEHISFVRLLVVACMNLLGALAIRMMYRYAYKCSNTTTHYGRLLNLFLRIFAGAKIEGEKRDDTQKIKIAIIGAGKVGVSLAEELLANRSASYIPRCFVDVDKNKVDRSIHGIPVLLESGNVFDKLKDAEVQEVVFAIPTLDEKHKKDLYEKYLDAGYKIKVYDFPTMQTAGGKRSMREFDIEELLFRKPIVMHDEKTNAYYKDKVVLITGGGGSIGSELCRQLAKMQPGKIIILDIYENGAYDVQQELKIAYGDKLNVNVEIMSITNKRGMTRVFMAHRPQIVINAAAHKHVPLMETNCIEAVENNVFGTKVLVDLCEEWSVERFMMVSTDKAVNPTNVMGATKRMCEMIIQSASTYGKVKYSSTRFGNVLGSAGSVIPLFKKQIANGGPITLTDKRIIRYFMTIPEAAQLVLQSGAMANNGELFVLDMGQPIKILDLAQNMIRLSGVSGIEIIETGLRPGEKLYEEILVKTKELDKTENSLIFIERDTPYPKYEIDEKLEILTNACLSDNDEIVRSALRKVVPTYKTPEEVNAVAESSEEMNHAVQFALM
jgi:FlaA1/EpsC-like NDP-sugar epimerase